MSQVETCRFRTSSGGASRCQEEPYADGFCRFHYECMLRGELLPNGQINEALSDQNRRRVINFHGQKEDTGLYVSE